MKNFATLCQGGSFTNTGADDIFPKLRSTRRKSRILMETHVGDDLSRVVAKVVNMHIKDSGREIMSTDPSRKRGPGAAQYLGKRGS